MRIDARTLDSRTFPDRQLDALYAAIQVNDVVDAGVALPGTVRLDYDRERLIDGFRIARALWRRGFDEESTDRQALIDMTRTLMRGDPFDLAAQLRFRHVRARFKHLRFAFVLYAADHRCPLVFKAVTTVMGHLQDAFRGERRGAVVRQAGLLRLLLAHVPLVLLDREVDRLLPSDTADYRRFVLAQVATLRTMLAQDAITGHHFHAARKIVSRQVSFHDDMRTLYPDPEHVAMSRYLSAINGLMGQFHDGLVVRRATGELNYARAEFSLPVEIRQRLAAWVALYP